MAEEKEKLTEAQEQDTNVDAQEQEVEEQESEDLFDPFADIDDDNEQEVEEQKEDQEEEKKVKKETQEPVEDKKARAKIDAYEAVDDYIEDNPEFEDIKKELRDYTAKAIERGHSDPVEFAVRNAKSPKFWMKVGEARARQALESAKSTTLRGSSASANANRGTQDFSNMASDDFNALVNQVKRGN